MSDFETSSLESPIIFKQGFSIWQVLGPPFEVVMLLFQSTRTKANAQASLT